MAASATLHHFDGQLGLSPNQPIWRYNNYKRQQLLNAVCPHEDGGREEKEERRNGPRLESNDKKDLSPIEGEGLTRGTLKIPRFEEVTVQTWISSKPPAHPPAFQ